METEFVIEFPNASTAEANRYAADLANALRDADPRVHAAQRRDNEAAQDLGTALQVVLGAASITAVAKGIATWIAAHTGTSIHIKRSGEVIVTNIGPGETARIAEALSKH